MKNFTLVQFILSSSSSSYFTCRENNVKNNIVYWKWRATRGAKWLISSSLSPIVKQTYGSEPNRHIDKKYEVRSHRFCIHQFPIKFDMRKFNFTNRVISVWNTLPDTVVSANTIDTFKARLDRFWSDQEVKYNWKSDIITGSRSQVSVIIEWLFIVYLMLMILIWISRSSDLHSDNIITTTTVGVIAGKTVWSMPECLVCEVLQKSAI